MKKHLFTRFECINEKNFYLKNIFNNTNTNIIVILVPI